MTSRERLLSPHPGGDERFLSGAVHELGAVHKFVRAHHTTVEPMDNATASGAADHADVGAIDFCNNVCNEIFWQAESVRELGQLHHNSHCNVLPSSDATRDTLCAVAQRLQSYKSDTRYSYGGCRSSFFNANPGIADLGCEVPQ